VANNQPAAATIAACTTHVSGIQNARRLPKFKFRGRGARRCPQ
jgi:hypothetical protein